MSVITKTQLLKLCRESDIKGYSGKSNEELLELLRINGIVDIKPDKPKCASCGNVGHKTNSRVCPLKVEQRRNEFEQVRDLVLSIPVEETIDMEKIAQEVDITLSKAQDLLSEIELDDLLKRPFNIEKMIDSLSKEECAKCKKELYIVKNDTHRIWKGQRLCDSCWFEYSEERFSLWKAVETSKPPICSICGSDSKESGQRYHYDHLNMFEKEDSICTMISVGENLDKILDELDKCQVLCVPCHHIITTIENRFDFTKVRSSITRRYNAGIIDEEGVKSEKDKYQPIYAKIMEKVYIDLNKILGNNDLS